ncbi:dapper homolog 3-like [Antennarius striatus]|uniref:dapper homolog 3-like n=1 Tax=Antennarius striatus TaxID=241820 RepID=UPI0035AEDF4C
MSVQEPPLPPPVAERGRSRERMEASLAGLCELELLKQRQESRVRSALCLGDSPVARRPPRGALRPLRCVQDAPKGGGPKNYSLQTGSLQCLWGAQGSLEQQVVELNLNTELDATPDAEDSYLCSGEVLKAKQKTFLETSYHILVPCSLLDPGGAAETKPGEQWLLDSTTQVTASENFGDVRNADMSQEDNQHAQKLDTYIFRLIHRSAPPTRLSKPRTSLTHEARVVSVGKQSHSCQKEEQHAPKQGFSHEICGSPQCSGGMNLKPNLQAYQMLDEEQSQSFIEDSPKSYHCHLPKGVQHQPGVYHTTDSSSSTLKDYPSVRVLQAHPDLSNCVSDPAQHFHKYPPPSALKPQPMSSPDDQLVNAEYIPAKPCRASSRAHVHAQSNPQKASVVPKPSRITYSPEDGQHLQQQLPTASQVQTPRPRGASRKTRLYEDKSCASRKPGRKTCRSQSENSLQMVPERRFNTVDRDCGASGADGTGSHNIQAKTKKQQPGASCRRWQSTAELSQDEAEQAVTKGSSVSNHKDNFIRRPRRSRLTRASYGCSHNHSQHHLEYQVEKVQRQPYQPSDGYPQPGQDESESSTSEADSPESSSLSTDSDGSGSLVWPQQLPPQLSISSLSAAPAPAGTPLQPKAFVKIKASQALKKKILRFHTGSLKVMTTV